METKSDRQMLASAFKALRAKGVLARMNFRCCGTCASFELTEQAEVRFAQGERVVNDVFWHRQSERSFGPDGNLVDELCLHHGLQIWENGIRAQYEDRPLGALLYDSSPESSAAIVEELRRHGLDATWDSDMAKCIIVRPRTDAAVA